MRCLVLSVKCKNLFQPGTASAEWSYGEHDIVHGRPGELHLDDDRSTAFGTVVRCDIRDAELEYPEDNWLDCDFLWSC